MTVHVSPIQHEITQGSNFSSQELYKLESLALEVPETQEYKVSLNALVGEDVMYYFEVDGVQQPAVASCHTWYYDYTNIFCLQNKVGTIMSDHTEDDILSLVGFEAGYYALRSKNQV